MVLLQSILKQPNPDVSIVEKILRQQLLWMLLLRVVLYTSLLAITFFFGDAKYGLIALPSSVLILLLLTVYLVSIISGIILNTLTTQFRRFGFIQAILDTVFASLLIYFTGSSYSIFASVYFFSIIAGGLILPHRGGLIAAAASTILYGIILLFEYYGQVPDYFSAYQTGSLITLTDLLNLFSVKGLTFFLAALLSAMFGMRLTTTEEVLSTTIDSFDKLSHLYKAIFDNIATGIITTNDHNIITSANAAAHAISGYSIEELVGSNLVTLFPNLDLQNKGTRLATDFTKKDGTTIRIGYSLTSLQYKGKDDHNTSSFGYEHDSKLITLQDISEIEKLELQIRQGEKMAAIGLMSAGIAHDFRNPLTAISGSAQVLAKEYQSAGSQFDRENLELTNIILRESNRLITTIADFLKFARPDIAERKWFSLNNCIKEVLEMCKADPKWPSTCEIIVDIDPMLDIWADEKQFFTVMTHLVDNAKTFCPQGKESIHLHGYEKLLSSQPEILFLTIEDNGPGIANELREKVFEPFFTNRADGTGLGLAIAKQTIENHKGIIEIDRSVMGGAKFTITLPLG